MKKRRKTKDERREIFSEFREIREFKDKSPSLISLNSLFSLLLGIVFNTHKAWWHSIWKMGIVFDTCGVCGASPLCDGYCFQYPWLTVAYLLLCWVWFLIPIRRGGTPFERWVLFSIPVGYVGLLPCVMGVVFNTYEVWGASFWKMGIVFDTRGCRGTILLLHPQ